MEKSCSLVVLSHTMTDKDGKVCETQQHKHLLKMFVFKFQKE